MSATGLSVLLWGVFLIALLVSGGVFCFYGYKKGLWHALISLGTTLVAFALSLLFANVLAPAFVPAVSGLLPAEEAATSSSLQNLLLTIAADGMIESILSLVFFFVFLLLFTVVLKIVGSKLQRDRFSTDEKRLRYAGLGVRVVDALIFTAFLLLPLYGTLSVYTSAMQSVLNFSAVATNIDAKAPSTDASVTDDTATGMALYQPTAAKRMSIKTVSEQDAFHDARLPYMDMLAGINEHPLVAVANIPPIKATYRTLGAFAVSEGSVEITEVVSTVDELLVRLENLIGKAAAEYGQEEQELVAFLRDEVVQTEWFYAVYCECLTQAGAAIADTAFTRELFATLQLTKEEFDATSVPLLDFADYLVSSRLINELIRPNVDTALLYEKGMFTALSEMLNSNKQMAALKALLLQDSVQFLFGDEPAVAALFQSRISFEPLAAPEQLQAEAEAIVAVFQNAASWERVGNTNKATLVMRIKGLAVIESLARHPMFGIEAIEEMMEKTDFEKYLGISSKYVSKDFEKQMLSYLRQSVAAPIGEKPFMQFVARFLADASYA